MEIPKKIKDEIWNFCRVNNISNIDDFTIKLITQGFTMEKFGATPVSREKVVEKIVEVEKVVEKIVEVPIEKIVEKIVEKEVYVSDNTEIKSLSTKILNLETQLIEMKNKWNEDVSTLQGTKKIIQTELEETKKLLEEEKLKNKNKRDLYGE